MMAADYRHIAGLENGLGRHYSRFPPFSPTPALADQSLALRKLRDAGSNRRSRVSSLHCPETVTADGYPRWGVPWPRASRSDRGRWFGLSKTSPVARLCPARLL